MHIFHLQTTFCPGSWLTHQVVGVLPINVEILIQSRAHPSIYLSSWSPAPTNSPTARRHNKPPAASKDTAPPPQLKLTRPRGIETIAFQHTLPSIYTLHRCNSGGWASQKQRKCGGRRGLWLIQKLMRPLLLQTVAPTCVRTICFRDAP
jgi:hypothetical protein